MKRKIVQVIIHISVWLCLFVIPHFLYPKPADSPTFPSQEILVFFMISNLYLVGFYYFNSSLLIPKLLARRKILFYVLTIFGFYVVFGFIQFHIHELFENLQHHKHNHRWSYLFSGAAAIFFLIFIVSSGIKIITEWFDSEKKKELVEHEKLETEISLLKAQINPHFLFNVLNTIYSLAVSQSDKTPDAVMKLSKLMRYVVNDSQADMVMLDAEIQYISNYIELQKMRLTDKVQVNYQIEVADIMEKRIAPLLLIPFVENAFKYGISTREFSPIDICLKKEGEWIIFEVKNRKNNPKNTESSNFGIQNVKKRLELIYPENYQLNIQDQGDTYQIKLKIILK